MREQHRAWEHSTLSQVSRNLIAKKICKGLSVTRKRLSIGATPLVTPVHSKHNHWSQQYNRPVVGMFLVASLAISSFLEWYDLHPFPFSTSYWTLVLQNHPAHRNSSHTTTSCRAPYQDGQTWNHIISVALWYWVKTLGTGSDSTTTWKQFLNALCII